jgi:dipeptidyl aminopeptidase/acylaminoacyl peptidase
MRSRSVWAALTSCRVVAGLCALITSTAMGQGQPRRGMTVDDVLALQSISGAVPSPNGEWLAVMIKRSGGPPDDENADVWLVPRHGGSPRNLTAGAGSRTRWRNPVWSPDGARLALLASTDELNLTPYIWTMRTGTLKPLIERDVDVYASFDRSWPRPPIMWLDSVTVLGAFWQRGALPKSVWGNDAIGTPERMAEDAWAKTNAGVEASVSVLESGRNASKTERPQGQLLRLDVRTGQSREIAKGYFWQILLDPGRRRAALIVDAGGVQPSEGRRLRFLHHYYPSVRRTRLAIADLDSIAPVLWVDAVRDPRMPEDGVGPHSWSPDGSALAVVAKHDPNEEYGTTAYLVSVEGGAVRQLTDRDLDVSATAWAGNGAVLIYARRTPFAAPGTDTNRYDWWRIDARADANHESGTIITSDLADVPRELQPTPDTNERLGLMAGRLISINVGHVAGTRYRVLSDSLALTWPWPSLAINGSAPDELLAQSAKGECYAIAWNSDITRVKPRLIPRPSADADLETVDPTHHLAVFTAAGPTGTTLWVGDGQTTQFERKVALNQQLRDIADPKRMLISYVGADGDSLKGLIVLPVDYVSGRRYPLIAFVYGGVMVRDTLVSGLGDKQIISALNLSVIPAHGYALLIPSVPVSPEGEAGDPMIDIPKGVLAAVDEATRVGVADPTRLGIMGISYGGYSTYSVITYTSRFRAAVAMAGFDDLASFYGDFNFGSRYADFGYEMQAVRGLSENGQTRMGASPWDNLWRYMRNSPYYFADRVQTPVMIIQGDMDFVGMEQGEEFFSAMYRMGKPATFVRYWGEGHVVERSAANVRDMWRRLFEWFDEHLAADRRSASISGH